MERDGIEVYASETGGVNVDARWHGCESSLFLPARLASWNEIAGRHRSLFGFRDFHVDRFEVISSATASQPESASEFDERLKAFAKSHDFCPECHNPLKHYNSRPGTGNCWANHHPGCVVWDRFSRTGRIEPLSPEEFADSISRQGWLFPRWLRRLLNRMDA